LDGQVFPAILDGDRLIADHDGIELPDLDAAKEEAILSARDLLGEAVVTRRHVDNFVFKIRDESNQLLGLVPFREALDDLD